MHLNRGIGEADPAQDVDADFAFQLDRRRIVERGQQRHLRRRQRAERVMRKPEEIARIGAAARGVADCDGMIERIDENRRDDLFDLVEQYFGEFTILEIAREGQPQLLIAFGIRTIRSGDEIMRHATHDQRQRARRGRLGPQPGKTWIGGTDVRQNSCIDRRFSREVLEKQRFRNPRGIGNPPGGRPAKAVTGEERQCALEDLLATIVARKPGRLHGRK